MATPEDEPAIDIDAVLAIIAENEKAKASPIWPEELDDNLDLVPSQYGGLSLADFRREYENSFADMAAVPRIDFMPLPDPEPITHQLDSIKYLWSSQIILPSKGMMGVMSV
jgi:hypothetical protein